MRRMGAALVVLLVLAGCTSPPEDAPADEAVAPSPAPSADPRIETAGAPPNETMPLEEGLAGEEHAHDGWNGATRLTLVDAQVEGMERIRLLDGFVLEGAALAEVLLDKPQRRACSPIVTDGERTCGPAIDASPPEGLHLWFRHAATREWHDAGAIVWGTPMIIAIEEPAWVDMPHSGLSLWEFEARAPSAEAGVIESESLVFHARVDIVRGQGEIPRWPGHPRFYAEAHEREVLRASGRTEDPGLTGVPLALEGASWVDASAVGAQKLISFETASLVVLVNVTATEAPPGIAPTAWELGVSNATGGWTWQPKLPADGPLRWVVPVSPDAMDSPYSDASRWRFALTGDLVLRAPTGGYASVGGMVPYTVAYEIVVVATDLPAEAYGGESTRV